jgi:hypothetical protein
MEEAVPQHPVSDLERTWGVTPAFLAAFNSGFQVIALSSSWASCNTGLQVQAFPSVWNG